MFGWPKIVLFVFIPKKRTRLGHGRGGIPPPPLTASETRQLNGTISLGLIGRQRKWRGLTFEECGGALPSVEAHHDGEEGEGGGVVLTRLCVYLHQQKPHKATESVQPKERCILQLILIRVSSGHLLLCVVHDKYGTRNQNFFLLHFQNWT